MGELERFRSNLQKLREQAANYGMDVPLALLNNIEFHEQKIRELEQSIPAGGEIFFQDDFASNQNSWFVGIEEQETGEVSVQVVAGALQLSLEAKTDQLNYYALVPEFYGENFVLQSDVTISAQQGDFSNASPAATVALRCNDTGDLAVLLCNGAFSIMKLVPNAEPRYLVDWRACEPVDLAVGSRLRVTIKLNGPNLQLSVGEQAIFALNDSSIMGSGQAYLGGLLFEKELSVTIEFRNLVIRALQ